MLTFVSLAYIHTHHWHLFVHSLDLSYLPCVVSWFPILPFPPYILCLYLYSCILNSSNTMSLSCHTGDLTVSVVFVLSFFLNLLVLPIPNYRIGFQPCQLLELTGALDLSIPPKQKTKKTKSFIWTIWPTRKKFWCQSLESCWTLWILFQKFNWLKPWNKSY